MYTYSQSKSERISAKERKEHHFIPANSLSHSNSKSSTQSNNSAAVKMSRNPSNTSYLTQHAQGEPTDPSTYRERVELEDMQPDPNSASSRHQLAQTNSSNTSGQRGNNNQGDNSASRDNRADFNTVDRSFGGQNMDPRSYGGSTSNSTTPPNPQMAAYLGQTQQQDTYHNMGGVAPGPRGGSQAGRGGYDSGAANSTSANRGSSSSGRSSGGQA